MPWARSAPRAIVMLLLARSAAADLPSQRDHAAPCRPTVSCTADLTTPGTLEVEAGFQSSRSATGIGTTTVSAPFLLKQTLSKLLQLQVGSNGYTGVRGDSHADYLDNLLLGAKLHLQDQKRFLPSLAVTALLGVPMFSAAGYVQRLDAFVTAHASKDIGPIHADLNGGVLEWGVDATPVSQGLVALALSMSLPPPFGIALETYYFSDSAPVALRDGGVRLAISATPRPWLVFDFGADVGFFPSSRAFSAFFGVTIVPVVLWR